MGLMNQGYSRLELARYFPWTVVSGIMFMLAVSLASRETLRVVKRRKTKATRSETQSPEGAEGEGKSA